MFARIFLYALVATIYGADALPFEIEKRALKDLQTLNGVILKDAGGSPITFNLRRSTSATPSAFGTLFNVVGGPHNGAFAKVVISPPGKGSGESGGKNLGGSGVIVPKPPSEGSDDFAGGSSGKTRLRDFEQEIAITKLVSEKTPDIVGKFIAGGVDTAQGRAPEDVGTWLVTEPATAGGLVSLVKNHPAFAAPADAAHCAQLADIATKTIVAGVNSMRTRANIFFQDFSSLGNIFIDAGLTKVKFIDFGGIASGSGSNQITPAQQKDLRNKIIQSNCPAEFRADAVKCETVVKRDLEGRAIPVCAPSAKNAKPVSLQGGKRPAPVRQNSLPAANVARPVPARKNSLPLPAANAAAARPVPARKNSLPLPAANAAVARPIPARKNSLPAANPVAVAAAVRAPVAAAQVPARKVAGSRL